MFTLPLSMRLIFIVPLAYMWLVMNLFRLAVNAARVIRPLAPLLRVWAPTVKGAEVNNRNRGQPRSRTEADTLQSHSVSGPPRVSLLRPGTGPLERFTYFDIYSAHFNSAALADLGDPGSHEVPAAPRFDGFSTYANETFQALHGEDLSAAARKAPTSAAQLDPHTPSLPSSLATSPLHSLSLEASLLLPPPPLLASQLAAFTAPVSSCEPKPASRPGLSPSASPSPSRPLLGRPSSCDRSIGTGGGGGSGARSSCSSRSTSRAKLLGNAAAAATAVTSDPAAPRTPLISPCPSFRRGSSRSPSTAAGSSTAAAGSPPAHPAASSSSLGADGSRRSLVEAPARCGAAAAAAVEQPSPPPSSTSRPSYMRSTASFKAKASTSAEARVARALALAAAVH